MGLAKPRVHTHFIRPFTIIKPRKADNDDRIKVRWFEQSGDESTRRPVSDLEAAADDEARELKAMLDKEDAELEEMRKELPEDELKILEDAIAEAKLGEKLDEAFDTEEGEEDEEEEDDDLEIREDNDLDLAKLAKLANAAEVSGSRRIPAVIKQAPNFKNNPYSPLDIQLYLSRDKVPYLSQLNQTLQRFSIETNSVTARELLWRWYAKCKQVLPPFLSLIPDPSWQLLEKSTRGADLVPKEQVIRSRILLDDMRSAGRTLDRPTRYRYLEYLLEEGRPMDAATQWKQDEVALRADRTLALNFEDMGVRIFAEANDIQKAQEIALGRMLHNAGPKTKCLIHIITYWTRIGSQNGLKRAWMCYDQLKQYMGSDMMLDDYDRVAKVFLDAGQTDISLAVFKDYMLTTLPERQARQTYDTSNDTLKSMLLKATSSDMLSEIALTRLALLPQRFNNKYFYASWMKRLIAAGDNTGAMAVVQLMYRRGVAPDAKHVNGIIGGLLRNGTAQDKEKAIQIAWSMVQQRLLFVAKRNGQSPLLERMPKGLVPSDWASVANLSDTAKIIIPAQVNHPLPSATIETFCLLLLFYTRRSMPSYIDRVKAMLVKAQIPPNTFFMNHLLYFQLRRGDHEGVWNFYRKMTGYMRPDLQTFACLWDTQKAHLAKVAFRERAAYKFSSPRQLYYVMQGFLASQTSHEQKNTKESMTQELYTQISSCFCIARDLEGVLVCLHAMKYSFGLYPDQDTARAISIQVSRIAEPSAHAKHHRARRRVRLAKPNVNLDRAARVLELLAKEREEQLLARGINVEEMDEAFKAEESLHILTAMLRTVIQQLLPDGKDIQEQLEQVAWDMGVSGIYLGDHLDKPEVSDKLDAQIEEMEEKIQGDTKNVEKTDDHEAGPRRL